VQQTTDEQEKLDNMLYNTMTEQTFQLPAGKYPRGNTRGEIPGVVKSSLGVLWRLWTNMQLQQSAAV